MKKLILHSTMALAVTVLTFCLLTINGIAQTCPDRCAAGETTLTIGIVDSVCFSIPSGKHATVCMQIQNLRFNQQGGCDSLATVSITLYKAGTMIPASPPWCTSALSYTFQAYNPPTTGNCPNGQDVQCCCLNEGKYILRICGPDPSNQWCVNYARCYDQGSIKLCIDCSDGNCQ